MAIIKVDYGTVGGGTLSIDELSFALNETQNIEIKNGFIAGYVGYASAPLDGGVAIIAKVEDGQYTTIKTTSQIAAESYNNGILTLTRVGSSSYGGGRLYVTKTD